MSVSDYSTTPAQNTSISGINIAEGCPPSGINNAIRQMMADIKAMQAALEAAIASAQAAALPKTGGTVSGALKVTGKLTASGGVKGNVVGNVTGNVTGNVSGSSGSCTGRAATAGRADSAAAADSAAYAASAGHAASADTAASAGTANFGTKSIAGNSYGNGWLRLGVIQLCFGGGPTGSSVTFPKAFTGVPYILCAPVNGDGNPISVVSQSTTAFTASNKNLNEHNGWNGAYFSWLAIGPWQ